jgi:hypothetical protein
MDMAPPRREITDFDKTIAESNLCNTRLEQKLI